MISAAPLDAPSTRMKELFHRVKTFMGLEGVMESAVGGEAGSGCRASETDGIRGWNRIADTGGLCSRP